MKIYRTPISKQKLASIPDKERSLFLVVGHISNEMNIYNKLFLWCSAYSTDERVLQKAHSSQSMALARVLAGKMWEAWTTIKKVYFSSKLSNEYDALLGADAQKAIQQLNKYMERENLVKTIRNKFAFHYDVEQITSGFEIPEHSEEWEIYLTQANGNCLYYAADLAANYALLNGIVPGDLKAAMNQLIEELIQVGGWFTAFLGECMLILGRRYFLTDEGNLLVEELPLSDAPLIKSVNIPYFVETPGSESET